MPLPHRTVTIRDLHRNLRASVFRVRRRPQTGLELEWLLRHGSDAQPVPPSGGPPSVADLLANLPGPTPLLRAARDLDSGREVPLRQGARLRVGPGGQMIYRSGFAEEPSRVIPKARLQIGRLTHDFQRVGVRSSFTGMDWSPGQPLPPSYTTDPSARAMEQWLARAGDSAVALHRSGCTLRIQLPLGEGTTARARLAGAESLAPTLAAMFANSPGRNVASRRMQVLTGLGAERPIVVGWDLGSDPAERFTDYLLGQPVALVSNADGSVDTMEETITFGDWLTAGHSRGHPTLEDWKLHLSTVLPLVAPAGHLRLSILDAVEPREAFVALLICHALLVWDDGARWCDSATDREAALVLACRAGLSDARTKSPARTVMDRAITVLERRTELGLSPVHLAEVVRFRREFVDRGRCPADDVRDRVTGSDPLVSHDACSQA